VAGFRFLFVSPDHHYLGEYVVAQPDWSEGDTFTEPGGLVGVGVAIQLRPGLPDVAARAL
jgi:hypothetical protein